MDILKDYANLYEKSKEDGFLLLGLLNVKCPAYCLHLDYTAEMKDPFFAYDKAVFKCYHYDQAADGRFIASLLGMGTDFFNTRRKYLLEHSYLTESETLTTVTDSGRSHYLGNDEFQIEVESHTDVFIDGRSFEIWSAIQRESVSAWGKGEKADLIYKPISGSEDELFHNILDDINDEDDEYRKEALGIDTRSKNFRFSTNMFDTCCITRSLLVFKEQKSGKVSLSPVDDFGIESFGNINSISFFVTKEGVVKVNTDLDKTSDEQEYSYICFPYNHESEAIECLLRKIEQEYGINATRHLSTTPLNGIPIRIKIDADTLENSRHRSSLVTSLRNGYHKVNATGGSFILVPVVAGAGGVQKLVDLDKLIQAKIDAGLSVTKKEIMELTSVQTWRKSLISIGRYDLLEQIDSTDFIKQ